MDMRQGETLLDMRRGNMRRDEVMWDDMRCGLKWNEISVDEMKGCKMDEGQIYNSGKKILMRREMVWDEIRYDKIK